jgi:hypothetical protein
MIAAQADSLTEEQVSEFKEAFSLFVSFDSSQPAEVSTLTIVADVGQRWRWYVCLLKHSLTDRDSIATRRAWIDDD